MYGAKSTDGCVRTLYVQLPSPTDAMEIMSLRSGYRFTTPGNLRNNPLKAWRILRWYQFGDGANPIALSIPELTSGSVGVDLVNDYETSELVILPPYRPTSAQNVDNVNWNYVGKDVLLPSQLTLRVKELNGTSTLASLPTSPPSTTLSGFIVVIELLY